MKFELEFVRGFIKEGVGVVTIDNPPMNPLSKGVIEGLEACMKWMEESDARVVILTGAGEKAFVAGADIKEFPDWNEKNVRSLTERGQVLFSYVENFPVPTVAAINGYALGGGLELALCCDIRIASEHSKLGLPEVSLGIIPGYGGTQRLGKVVPMGYAKLMIFTGMPITAQRGMEIGLLQNVVDSSELMNEALSIGEKICQHGPLAVKGAKRAINYQGQGIIEKGLKEEIDITCQLFASEDKREGVAAFIEKRKPVFQNR